VKHYYRDRLKQPEFWLKLTRGKVAGDAFRGLWSNLRRARRTNTAAAEEPFQTKMAAAWMAFDGSILVVLSGDDYTAKEFLEYTSTSSPWQGVWDRPCLQRHDAPGADHTFSKMDQHNALEAVTGKWLAGLAQAEPPRAGGRSWIEAPQTMLPRSESQR
jgi:hypothetical protein